MILITSAAYITPGLASEFGKLPPCMLPVQNKRLYEHQIALFPKDDNIVISLPKSYQLTPHDKKRLSKLCVKVVNVPDNLKLGESIVYVLNVIADYSETIKILHGDTLYRSIDDGYDFCATAQAEDEYEWSSTDGESSNVFSGYFSFSNQSLLIQSITSNDYNFMKGIKEYSNSIPLKYFTLPGWMDFGLVNTYYRSISKLTTERVFNNINVNRYCLRKSSKDKLKIKAEANWILSLPASMKHYAPSLWKHGENEISAFYDIEYYFLSSLASLFVFGKSKNYVWKEIIDACIEYLDDEFTYKPKNILDVADNNNNLYTKKTIQRLNEYSRQSGISLTNKWIINGTVVPSLIDIIEETDKNINKNDYRFVSLMHGDACFSNILYDFKSKSVKLIDPRGLDSARDISIYGDFRYDVGKLAHSILGLYDFIIGGMFYYKENTQYDIIFNIDISNNVDFAQNYFRSKLFGGFNINELSTYPIMIHLFLSMLPLHKDNHLRQKAMLANALRLYVELKNKYI